MDQAIQDFIKCKRIAIAGVSREGTKFGNTALTELAARGYQVFAVHPEAKEIADTVAIMSEGKLLAMKTKEQLQHENLEKLYLDYIQGKVAA